MNDAPFRVKGPRVNAELVGVFPTVGQTIEDRYGNPIKVNADINGKKYTRPIAGPHGLLEQASSGGCQERDIERSLFAPTLKPWCPEFLYYSN